MYCIYMVHIYFNVYNLAKVLSSWIKKNIKVQQWEHTLCFVAVWNSVGKIRLSPLPLWPRQFITNTGNKVEEESAGEMAQGEKEEAETEQELVASVDKVSLTLHYEFLLALSSLCKK